MAEADRRRRPEKTETSDRRRSRAEAIRLGAEPPKPAAGRPVSRIVQGDVLKALREVGTDAVQTVVTSPPYWGLRDYGVPPTIWGGKADCRHRWRDGLGGRVCERCEGWEGCLGLEARPDLYVAHLVLAMQEVRRCLRPDGTLWLVLGDSFAKSGHRDSGLKHKDLVGIPWRVALALQADGWWLRSDNIWQKPNVMPEPIRDRPTRAHEYVFLLSPSERYYYDGFAVREPDRGRRSGNGFARPARLSYGGATSPRGQADEWIGGGGRNRRSVWTIASQGYRGAHSATFPEALVEVCVLAGTSPVSCSCCGAPWDRIVETIRLLDGEKEIEGDWTVGGRRGCSAQSGYRSREIEVRRRSIGWSSSCGHDDPGARCLVLDPFAGSGTTGAVAAGHGRDFLGIELSREFAAMARERIADASAVTDVRRSGGEG